MRINHLRFKHQFMVKMVFIKRRVNVTSLVCVKGAKISCLF